MLYGNGIHKREVFVHHIQFSDSWDKYYPNSKQRDVIEKDRRLLYRLCCATDHDNIKPLREAVLIKHGEVKVTIGLRTCCSTLTYQVVKWVENESMKLDVPLHVMGVEFVSDDESEDDEPQQAPTDSKNVAGVTVIMTRVAGRRNEG